MEPNTRVTVGLGLSVSAVEALACDKLRAWAFDYVNALFADHQLTAIVSPTVPISAPPIPAGGLDAGESNTELVVEMMKYVAPSPSVNGSVPENIAQHFAHSLIQYV